MKGGSCMKFLPVLLLSAFVYAQNPKIPRMADGHPDLQGFWNNASLTPLERPVALGDKQVFTAEEAAAFERNRLQEVNRDRRDGGTQADAARAYNEAWFDRGTKVSKLSRTSQIGRAHV
mgnify:FL=1